MSTHDVENRAVEESQQTNWLRSLYAETLLFVSRTKARDFKYKLENGYTTHSFNRVKRLYEKPIHVDDIFFSSRILIFLRLTTRGAILVSAGVLFILRVIDPAWWLLTLVIYILELKKIQGVGRIGIPSMQQLWSFHRYPQRFWEIFASKVLLLRPKSARLWWFVYLLIADLTDFERNFVNAWSLRNSGDSPIRASEDRVPDPGPEDETGEAHDRETESHHNSQQQRNSSNHLTPNENVANQQQQHNGGYQTTINRIAPNQQQRHNVDQVTIDRNTTSQGQRGNSEEAVVNRNAANHQQHDGDTESRANATTRPGSIGIFIRNEYLSIPILSENMTDSDMFKQLKMFYRYLKVKRGLAEQIIPRRLVRINVVEVEESMLVAGQIKGSLNCGRRLQHFYHPETNPAYPQTARAVTEEVKKLKMAEGQDAVPHQGLEFVRRLDRNAMGGVIMTPPLASLVSIIVWLSIYLRPTKENDGKVDVQVVVTTAFTIATYLVTARKYSLQMERALVTALIAYLDSNPREGDGMEKSPVAEKSSQDDAGVNSLPTI